MNTLRSLASLCIAFTGTLFAQTSTSDCNGAIQLCGGLHTEQNAPQGTGNVYEFTGTCNLNQENASLWYTFTVQTAGDLSFVLDPANDMDDYDWGLFNITNGGCAGINAQNGSSPEVACNSYGLLGTNGQTGISTANGGTGNSNGPGDLEGPPFNADLPVIVGQTYALVVMNWTGSTSGYTIDFTQSTAAIYDDVPPTLLSATPDCANQSFLLEFSEPIVTSSVSAADFTLTSPTGTVFNFVSVTPSDVTAFSQSSYTIGLGSIPMEGGTYMLTIMSAQGNWVDPCGNDLSNATLPIPITAPFSYTVDITSACNGTDGGLQATYVSGGIVPVTFSLGGTLLPSGAATGLLAGEHVLQVNDGAGCQILETLIIPDHLLAVVVPQDQDSLSCRYISTHVQGVEVVPDQAVDYLWTSVTFDGTNTAFSTSPSPLITQPGIYTVLVTDLEDGCTDQASVEIYETAAPAIDLASIMLPNLVSPNGDGKNDVWRPFLLDDPTLDITVLFDTYQLTIYNRWGQAVFATDSGGQRSWNARDVDDGTYFYKLAYQSDCGAEVAQEIRGTITVLR